MQRNQPKTYMIETFGCQMNDNDSEVMSGILEQRGLRAVTAKEDADLLLINTCIVRGTAEERAMGHIGALKPLRKRHPHRIYGVCGCLAQRDGERLLKKAPHLDLVLGTRAIPRLEAMIDRIQLGEGPIACIEKIADPYEIEAAPVRRHALRSLVTIMYGCNKYCTFCIVPRTRGVEESRTVRTIVSEIEDCVAAGSVEVTLVGQNVNSYKTPEANFGDLLRRVNQIDGLKRIRYTTPHPRDASEDHLRAIAECDKICDHLHLPVQSGSSHVLERMHRRYTREEYLDKVAMFRQLNPQGTLTTDIIVGFPGESEAQFQETLSLVEEVRYDAAFTFYYNERSGTKAAQWDDDITLEIKKRRLTELMELQNKISLEINETCVGQTYQVLVETPAKRSVQEGGFGNMMARTTGDKCVIYNGDKNSLGQLINVKITQATRFSLFGKQI